MAASSGLKRSQRVSKCRQNLGVENIRASHMVSQCHEPLGAERIRPLHDASKCHETLSAERTRACHTVSQCHETLGAESMRASRTVAKCRETLGAEHISASHRVSKCHEPIGAEHIRASPFAPGYNRTVRRRSRPSTCCWDAKGRQYHSHPDEDAVKNAAPKRSWNPFPNIFLGLKKAGSEKKLETKRRTFQMDAFAYRSDQRQPQSVISRSARTPSRRGPKTSLKFCGVWIAPGRRPSAL